MIRRTVLPGGTTVLSENVEGFASASVGLFLGVGSREESPEDNGIAHLFEHAVFKGTRSRGPLELVEAVESRGGLLNAYTTREQTCFYARTGAEDLLNAVDVLCEMVREPALDPEAIRLEKGVVLEEIRSCLDDPEDLAGDLFCEALWGKDGPGLPIAGTLTSVRRLGMVDLRAHHMGVMRASTPMVVAAAGKVDHDALVEAVRSRLPRKRALRRRAGPAVFRPRNGIRVRNSAVQQASVALGTFLPSRDPDSTGLAVSLVHLLLGEGMSSRLFQRVREELGLVYSVATSVDVYSDGYGFNVQFAAEPGKADRALEVIASELALARREGFSDGEIAGAKRMMRGAATLAAESSSARAAALAQRELSHLPPEELAARDARVAALPDALVRETLRAVLVGKKWACGAVLPKGQKLDLRKGLAF